MTTLQIKTTIPDDRHVTLDLNLPETVQPGDVDILLMIKNQKDTNLSTKKELLEKLDNGPVWSDEDLAGFREFRREINKWQPDKF